MRREINRHLVVYAGRFVDQVADADLPDNCIVLGEQEALPQDLARILKRASVLVFLDLSSFPLETITDEQRDVPIVVVLPPGFDAESLITAFGSTLFERLGFFDRIVTLDTALWEELRRKYRWAESQRIPFASAHPDEVALAVHNLFEAELMSPTTLVFDKALHRAQAAVLESWFAASQGKRDAEAPLDVLEVGVGVGHWMSSFDPAKTRFTGIDVREDLLETARTNFPEGRFDSTGSEWLLPYDDESFDLVFSVTTMHHNPAPVKRALLSEMWRVTRPNGRLLFLENFVFTKQVDKSAVHPISVMGFVDLVIDATAGQVVLEYVESLRYPDGDLREAGLISLLRLGISEIQ